MLHIIIVVAVIVTNIFINDDLRTTICKNSHYKLFAYIASRLGQHVDKNMNYHFHSYSL